MYLLDTCIVIPLFKGRFQLQEKACAVGLENCFLSDLVIAEMLVGVYKTKHPNEVMAIEYARKTFTCVPVTEDILDRYARIRAEMETEGIRIDSLDLLLAATAMEKGFTLVTHNTRHFSRIPNLMLEDWIVSE